MYKSTVLSVGLALSSLAMANADRSYFRTPDISKHYAVFSSEGDLWRAELSGANPARLTSHMAQELYPLISPDEQHVVFTANYENRAQLYVMPMTGGAPKQITFENGRVVAQAWTIDGKIIYSAPSNFGPSRQEALFIVDPNTLSKEVIPLSDANQADVSADGKTLVFTRGGLHLTNDNARAYRGGNVSSLWRWNLGSKEEAIKVSPSNDASYKHPMISSDWIYHVSDYKGIANLFRMRHDGSQLESITTHTDFEVRSPRLHGNLIIYQHGGALKTVNVENKETQNLSVNLVSDYEQSRPRWLNNPLDFLSDVTVTHDGKALALTSRGNTIVASASPTRKFNINMNDTDRVRATAISPDQKYLYAISDRSGEQQIWRFELNGRSAPLQLTKDTALHRWRLHISPDGKWLIHDDKNGKLWRLNLETLNNDLIDDGSKTGTTEFTDVTWSSDSRFISYSKPENAQYIPQIKLVEVASGKNATLTSEKYQSFSPAFSSDNKWLYFLSDRYFKATPSAPWGDRNMGPHFDKRTEVFAIALTDDLAFPFNADTEFTPKKSKPKDDKKASDKETAPQTKILWNDIDQRQFKVPVSAGNYQALSASAERLYLVEQQDQNDNGHHLKTIEISNEKPKLETFAENIGAYGLSGDRKRLWMSKVANNKTSAFYVLDVGAKAPAELDKAQIQLNGWKLSVSPKEEWRQMFFDAWRMQRDFLYDKELRGVNWVAVREKYTPLLERVNTRQELDDVLAQMVAELGVLHSQIAGGEIKPDTEAPQTAFLGAITKALNDGYRVEHIYQADLDLLHERSPLDRPEIGIKKDDVITHINHLPVNLSNPIEIRLLNQAGQQVRLDIRRGEETFAKTIYPIDSRADLMLQYGDWERRSLNAVKSLSSDKVGYIHLRAMGGNDIASFARDFFAQTHKDALVVDVRRNNGGNIDSWIVQQFLRETWGFWSISETPPVWNMQQTFRGHVAFLIDEYTYSDGETFAAAVKSLNLGPLIGKRTAGAGVWLSDTNRLVDGGMMRAAQFAQYRADGEWIVEGLGVAPDIEVENLPFVTHSGKDAQLETAVNWLLQKIKSDPVKQPTPKALAPMGTPAKDVVPLKR